MKTSLKMPVTKPQTTQALILLALSTIDLAMTVYLIVSGIGFEGTPAFSSVSFTQIGLIKTVSLVIVIGICYYLDRYGIIVLLNKAMVVVAIWNLILILITVGVV